MKRLILLATLLSAAFTSKAQYVTYNHDEPKMNQVTVMEIGSGTLKPAAYYSLLHNGYRKTAAEKNKLGFRTEASAALYGQTDMAEKIDSALTARAKVEALNMADRKVDLAWQTEGARIESKLESFQGNIDRIVRAGGSPSDRARWMEYCNVIRTAITATREAYMPNAQRKKEYVSIYEDLSSQNELLVRFIVSLCSRRNVADAMGATLTRTDRTAEIADEARSRWKGTSSNTITE